MAKAETATVNFKSVFGSSTLQTIADKITPVENTQDGEIAKITYQKNESMNAPAYNKDGSMRLYKPDFNNGKTEGCSITITPASNITITEVSFTFTSAAYALTSNSVTEGTYADNKWTGNTTSALTFTNRGTEQVRIKSITITYTKEVAGPKDYEQTFADMTLEVGESKVIDLGEEHPETFVIDAGDVAIAEVVEAEGVFTITGKAVGTTKVSVMWEGEGWNGGETEFNVTVNPVLPAPELSFDKAEITEYIGSLEQDLPVLTATEGLKITYSSSNEAAATIDAQTGAVELVAAGTTTITATSEATAEYKAGEASYILNVKAAATGAGGFVLLTDIGNLDGKQGLIVGAADETYYGAGDINSNKKLAGVNINVENNTIAEKGNCVEFTFTKTGDATYTLQNSESSYLAKGSGSTDMAWSDTKTTATVTIDATSSQATISYTEGRRIRLQKDKNGFKFSSYSNKANDVTTGTNPQTYYPVQIYVKEAGEPVVIDIPSVFADGNQITGTLLFEGEKEITMTHPSEGARLYYSFIKSSATPMEAPARVQHEGKEFTRYTEPIKVTESGTLHYFAEVNGVKSEVKNVLISDTTGVEDITVGGEEGEAVYYDMTGRRVANPTAGLYIRVNGSTATKVYLR